ncbi:DNA cytosine methyltransferase [Luteolibacter yonseiensis]|uniref:Cytosine-specific methyltransferase n=1 Tax=Luteolibacter yonseiensis TaxID=1144680 RepID=A0A934R5N6_9BACT|nr:DNA (cytosine-5-)-methyltransferase [Luteolibacter yonseiensis]MBK1816842.1 DNA cytosine methyltransferase [Luteolibacter yonseiensis]
MTRMLSSGLGPSAKEVPSQAHFVGIDLFCGAGGMTLGAQMAGIEVIYAVEKCPHAAATYRLNFPKIPLYTGDIRKLRMLPKKSKGVKSILFGGPPCQGFSTSNQRTRNSQNPNNWLFQEFIRMVQMWNPDYIVMENVKGITETEGGSFLETALNTFKMAGYKMSFSLLNAVDFGVPQRRTRAFFVGARNGGEFVYPCPTTLSEIPVLQAISDLPVLENGACVDEMDYRCKAESAYAKRLRKGANRVTGNIVTKNCKQVIDRYSYVPHGGNWEDIPESLFGNYADRSRCHTGIYKRLDPKKASVVIGNFRKNMLIHPYENRGLSVREAARIQSVPDHFLFSGSIGFQQQQVGNMVPPILAKEVFNRFF